MARFLIASLAGAALSLAATPALAGDAGAGAKVFKANCAVCHATTATAAPGVGPSLFGVVGRKAGTLAAFRNRYSPAMKASGLTWSEDELALYVANPAKVVKGNAMPFAGLHDAKQVQDVVAYLNTLK